MTNNTDGKWNGLEKDKGYTIGAAIEVMDKRRDVEGGANLFVKTVAVSVADVGKASGTHMLKTQLLKAVDEIMHDIEHAMTTPGQGYK